MKNLLKEILPPIVVKGLRKIAHLAKDNVSPAKVQHAGKPKDSNGQDLDVYWDDEMAALLETWGKDHVWNEIQMFLVGKEGRALDIACGTGITMEIVAKNSNLEVYGCDISDLLISKAVERGIDRNYLQVCDATNMDMYPDNFFDYSYSIGSLEHFTEDGIMKFVAEVQRVTKYESFHMMPTSKSGRNEGWITPYQSYFNNNEQWWIDKFTTKYSKVYAINSGWKDDVSIGKWFVCMKSNK